MKKFILTFCVMLMAQAAGGGVMRSALPQTQTRGPDAAILEAVAKALGSRLFVYYAPFKRRLIMMENGDIDLMCGLLKGPEREGYIYFVPLPYKNRSDTVFFMRKDEQKRLTSYEDLKAFSLGVTRGTYYWPRFDRDLGLRKTEAPQAVTNFRKLLLGRLDAVAVNESLGIDLMNQLGVSGSVGMAPFRFSREKHVYFGISRKSRMMKELDRIHAVLGQMITSGRIREILTGYYRTRNLPVPAM